MKKQRATSLQIRLASLTILGLLIALAAAAYFSGRQVSRDGDLIAQDAVPGTINAHYMRMAMSRSLTFALGAATAKTPEFRDASLKAVHEADATFADALKHYESTIRINPQQDKMLLERLKSGYTAFYQKRMAFEALILAGDRDGSATFLERELVPAYVPVLQSAEELLKYNHGNNISLSNSIRSSVHLLYWAVAVVMVLAMVCALVLVSNLTIRRRELAELQQSEEKFSKAFQSNPSGIAITEIETGRYIEVNASFCRILGYPPEEVIGYTTLDKGIWNSEEESRRILQPLLTGGTLHHQEIQTRTRHGVRKTLSLNAEVIELEGRKCVVSLIEDITGRKQAEAALLASEELLRRFIKHTPAAVAVLDMDLRYLQVSERWITDYHLEGKDVIGRLHYDVFPEIPERWKQIHRRALSGQPQSCDEDMFTRADGSVEWLQWVIQPWHTAAKETGGVIFFTQLITERKRNEIKLRDSEELFRTSFESATAGVCLVSADGKFFNVNRTLCHMLGYTKDELLQLTFNDVTHEDDKEIGRSFLGKALSGGPKTMQTEKRYLHKDGRVVWAFLSTAVIDPVPEHGGYLISHIQDITQRKQAEEALRMSENKFSLIFRESPIPLGVSEFDTGRILEVNNAYLKLMHATPEQLLGRTSLEIGIITPEERTKFVEKVRTHGGADRLEIALLNLDAKPFISELTCTSYELSGKSYLLTAVEDITERRQWEQKQAELAAIVESSEDAIIGKSLAGIITSWNRGAEKIFGYAAAEVIGKPLLVLFPIERQHEEADILARISRGETVQHFETIRVCKDGREIFISATISPLRDSSGNVIGASKIARDITAQKLADAALRESEERIRILGDNLPSGMMYQIDMGADGLERRFTYVSAGVEKLHEVTAEAVLQDAQVIYGQVVEADRPLVVAREAEALACMKPFMAELRMQLPSGLIRWSLFTSAPRRAANGHVLWDGIELDITSQKQAEKVLREKQAQLHLAMDIARLAHWEFDVETNSVTADEHIFHLLGTSAEQEGGVTMSPQDYIHRFVHPEDAGIVASEVSLGIASEDPNFAREFEHRIIRRDGAVRVMLVRCQIHMNDGGRAGKILGTNQDITEQKQSELRIRQLNRIYAVLSDINQAIVHEKDSQAMLTKACQIAVEKGGFRMAWVGMHDAAAQKVRPEASAGVVEGYLDLANIDLSDKARSGGPTGQCFLSGEHVICNDMEHDPLLAPWREDALKRGYRSSASFPLKVSGSIIGIFTLYSGQVGFFDEEEIRLLDELAQDIGFALEVSQGEAKRRQAEQELRWRTAFFEAQVHSAIDGILVVDSAGKKLLQNQRMTELWKIPPHIADDSDDTPQLQFVLGRVREPDVFIQKTIYLKSHQDESSTDVIELVDGTILERYSAPVRGSDGTYYGRVWTFHDITERKKMEQQFLRAQRMESIGTLASGVAHDLNNILTPIMMSAPVLRMRISDESRGKIIDTIEASAARGAQIVKQVLTFSRGLEGEMLPLQVETVVIEMEQMIRSTFPKDITVECVIEPRLWLVLGDATQLHQVLLNLCVNARDAMPNGGTLRLRAANLDIDASYASMLPESTPGHHVLLEVSDTGSGIPPEILERIFDPFFTTKGVGKGTGLGLSTVHGIVKSHGGFLKVVSDLGKGTTFKVYLPVAPDQVAVTAAAASAPPPTGHGELVLVVDDEPAVINAAQTVLETNGYRVMTAADATEALVKFTENSHDIALVITDVVMPVMDGVLFLRTLRQIKPKIPVIASTGQSEQKQVAAMRELGIETVLHKPYNAGTLLRTVHAALHPKP